MGSFVLRRSLVLCFALLGLLFLVPPAFAVGAYDNALIADKALSYVGQWGGNATREAGRSGTTGSYTTTPQTYDGQCRAFVNEIVWIASGHTQWVGGGNGAFAAFLANGTEIGDINQLVKGDVVQFEDSMLHTFIIVSRASGNTFNVVDSNWSSNEIVQSHQITFSLSSTRRAFRLGTVGTPPPPPTPPPSIVAPQSAGFTRGGTPSYWNASGLGVYGTGLYCYTGGWAIDNWARWTFDLNALKGSAIYKVEAFVPHNYATTTNAIYHINTAGGQQDRAVNQLALSDVWADLGTYAFNAGSAWVQLDDATGEPYVNASSPKISFDCVRFTYVTSAPTITGINPASGTTEGGTSIIISGTGFIGATDVMFGGIPAAFTVISNSQITAFTPAHASGTVQVQVTTPGGSTANTSADDFTYLFPTPTVTSITPTSGPAAGGTSVIIRGTNLTRQCSPFFGDAAAAWRFDSSTQITATSPAHNAGPVHVRLVDYDFDAQVFVESPQTSADVFTYVVSDTTAPTTTAIGADDLWHRSPVAVTLSAVDNPGGSGVTLTEYQIDAGNWILGTTLTVAAPADHSGDGIHTVRYHSCDAAWNVEQYKSVAVKIDTTTPAGSFFLAGGAATTTTTAVSGASSVSDAHGPLEQRFSTDGKATWSSWSTYVASTPLTLPAGVGTKTVYAQYRDAAGNVLELNDGIELVAVAADTTAPTTTVSGVDDAWHAAPVTLTFLATDNAGGSGMSGGQAKTEYKLDDGPWTAGTSLIVPAPLNTKTTHAILYRSTDNAGNLEVAKSCTVKIDTTRGPPPLDTTAPTTTAHGADSDWHAAPVALSFTAEDTGTGASGVAFTEYKLDDGAWTRGTSLTVPAPAGVQVVHTVLFRSQDNAGNLEAAKSCTVKINTMAGPPPADPPTTSASGYDDAWHRSPVTVSFTALPAVGGLVVAYTEYRLDGGEWTRGTRLTVPASADHSADGLHTISYRSADIAVPANVENEQTCTVKIDTTGPTISTKNARGSVGHGIALKLCVDDALSPQATAITVVVRNARGAAVMRWTASGTRATGTWMSRGWTPRAKGTYRYYVTATDLAGNAQGKVGSAKVIVR